MGFYFSALLLILGVVVVVVVVVVEIQFICLKFMATGGWYTRGWLGIDNSNKKKEVKFNRINFTTISKDECWYGFYNGT